MGVSVYCSQSDIKAIGVLRLRVSIIDADLIGRKRHRFPNLACMKISSYHKSLGDYVELLTAFEVLGWDKVYVSKVFTDTEVPEEVLSAPNVEYGGTGFYYDTAPDLPYEIEHSFPDYHLYDSWVQSKLDAGGKRKDFVYYLDYSIGFLTRGCFRKCEFCVNRKYDRCLPHSPLSEFYDPSRPKLCFLDDNFFACPKWESIISEVNQTGKRFQFKQGLDFRLLTEKKIHSLMSWAYDGAFIFAFDDIADRDIIEKKFNLFMSLYPNRKRNLKFYVFCGYDSSGRYDDAFFKTDVRNTLERITILYRYNAYPYLMRFKEVYRSRYSGFYATLCAWTNQINIFATFSFREFCQCKGMGKYYKTYKRDVASYIRDIGKKGSTWRYMEEFEAEHPDIASKYFDRK